jgi:Mitochondrial inner membrane protein
MPKPPSTGAPPSSSAAGGAGASSSSSSSSWQLSPSVPIDVRLLGAGAVGAGALLYSLSGDDKKKKSNDEAGSQNEENAFVIEDESTSDKADELPEERSEPKIEILNETAPPTDDEKKVEIEKEEPAIVVDSHEVLKMIEDVLSKPAEQMLSEDTAALSSTANDSNIKAAATTTRKERVEEKEERKERDIQAAQVAITTAIAETAAESVSSDIAKAPKGVAAMTPSSSSSSSSPSSSSTHSHHKIGAKEALPTSSSFPIPPTPSTPSIVSDSLASASAKLAGINPDVLSILGLHADLTASGLLADSMKSGSGPGDNWEEYAYRHKQAESDAEILGTLLDSAAQHVKKQLTAAQMAAIAGHEEAEEAKKAAAAQAERFRAALIDALKKAEEGHRVQMNQQAEKLANAHAEMTVRERVERQKIVDELRRKLGALERALEKRGDAARGSTTAHRMAQGAFALQETLDKGGNVDTAVEYLNSACGSDPLISAAVRALPRGQRILTPVQLADEFSAVEKAAKELSMLPAGHGGMLSAAVAKLASKLKLKESSYPSSSSELLSNAGGIDAKLGEIEAEVVNGKYTQAARKLEDAVQGTAAAVAVKDWVDAARARAAAEQAVAVVEAHAATAALSLA